jgi:hypothetical protein
MSYAKIFPSMFEGSMRGAGSVVIAVWTYALSNARIDLGSTVELFPRTVAEAIGDTQDSITKAISTLCSPDEMSRTHSFDGRRLIPTLELKVPIPFQPEPHANLYYIPSYDKYCRSDSTSKDYWKLRKRLQRQKIKMSSEMCTQQNLPNLVNNGHLDTPSPSSCPAMSSNVLHNEYEYEYNSPPRTFLKGVPLEITKPTTLQPAIRISYEKELARADARLKDLRSHYEKPFPPPILSEIKSIKARSAYLKKQLGALF